MDTVRSNLLPSIDRPDIAKTQSKAKLSFKEVKDSIFKFLMQTGIPFTESVRLYIKNEYTLQDSNTYTNAKGMYYTSTCRLDSIKVAGEPVYVIVVQGDYGDLPYRQRNKLTLLRQHHHIVILDESDCRAVGINVTDRSWLKPLNKRLLKAWSRKLFEKISKLGNVETNLTLNDLYSRIDFYTAKLKGTDSLLNMLMSERDELRFKLHVKNFELRGPVYPTQLPIIKALSSMPIGSVSWVEDVLHFILVDILFVEDWDRPTYQRLVRSRNKIDLSEMICKHVKDVLQLKRPQFSVTNLGKGFLEIRNRKTFQAMTVRLGASFSDKVGSTAVPKSILDRINTPLVSSFNIKAGPSALDSINTELFLLSNSSSTSRYSAKYRLEVYNEYDNEFSLNYPED